MAGLINGYVERTEITTDIGILKAECDYFFKKYVNEVDVVNRNINAIGLRKRPQDNDIEGLRTGSISLWDEKTNMPFDYEWSFTEYNSLFDGTYTQKVLKDLEKLAMDRWGLKMSRARLNKMDPKSCLTYHRDTGNSLRFHIPIHTNNQTFFMHQMDTISTMPEEGRVYLFDSVSPHTAVNPARTPRTHLVVVCYKDEDCYDLQQLVKNGKQNVLV